MKTFCTECGNENMSEAKFCGKCGISINLQPKFKKEKFLSFSGESLFGIRAIKTPRARIITGLVMFALAFFCFFDPGLKGVGVLIVIFIMAGVWHIYKGIKGVNKKKEIIDNDFNNNESEILFYYIKPWKFILLSIFSLGLFNIIWFYKNWSALKFYDDKYKQSNISPSLRAWFGMFTSFELFPRILNSAKKLGYKGNYSGKFLGFLYLFLIILLRVFDKIDNVDNLYLISLIIYISSSFVFIPVLNAIKFNNSKVKVQTKIINKLSNGQIIFTIFGIIIFFFYLGSGFMEGLKISNPEYIKQVVNEVKKNTSFPKIIDENTTWLNIEAENNSIRYDYNFSGLDTLNLSTTFFKNYILSDACKNFKEDFLNRGIDIQYSYTDIDTGENYFFTITNKDCN